MSTEHAPNTDTEPVCPSCGEPYEYRVRDHGGVATTFNVANEYRCDPPQHPHVYFHKIPAEQAVDIAYPPRKGPMGVRRQ